MTLQARRIALLALAVAAAGPFPAFAADRLERSFDLAPGGRFHLKTAVGRVRIASATRSPARGSIISRHIPSGACHPPSFIAEKLRERCPRPQPDRLFRIPIGRIRGRNAKIRRNRRRRGDRGPGSGSARSRRRRTDPRPRSGGDAPCAYLRRIHSSSGHPRRSPRGHIGRRHRSGAAGRIASRRDVRRLHSPRTGLGRRRCAHVRWRNSGARGGGPACRRNVGRFDRRFVRQRKLTWGIARVRGRRDHRGDRSEHRPHDRRRGKPCPYGPAPPGSG